MVHPVQTQESAVRARQQRADGAAGYAEPISNSRVRDLVVVEEEKRAIPRRQRGKRAVNGARALAGQDFVFRA